MAVAARAIIIENDSILVMKRIKEGVEYYTLVGGRIDDGENPENAVAREVMEETGLIVTTAKLVFTEKHYPPYNDQMIFICEVAPHGEVRLQPHSEEHFMNKIDINIHIPEWVPLKHFSKLQFNTMRLQKAIQNSLENGFPNEPEAL